MKGSWLVYQNHEEIIRLHSNTFGKQTVYFNNEKVTSFRVLKSHFEYDFEKEGQSYSIKMRTESHSKTQNVTTFHKNDSIIRIFKSHFKFSVSQISIIIIPIIIISISSTLLEVSSPVQYSITFVWFIIALLITGKNYLEITESENPNFE